ncbi:uncharacterized protein Z518_01362 [Rhinocladiella mackenziei CBS 650.93]|uniref:CmcJ-like methyltransferase n=1 Tax=Rhinocladiella mackenziei CBS 650.93 TaxID=1442369 RepID=A0A0D2JLE1_9EURO|nr:uncharacterized protein Z518_01362 [Rhinocladiella mackenziei CBS 650.93]KIX10280.1 hypothetical protein Z518_01362 [Rhinocladiella mackenziei CBS 650.93]
MNVVHSNTHFLKRDELYSTEKPYSLRFTPPEGFLRSNIKLEKHEIDIHDIRNHKSTLNFQRDGVAILDFESKMVYEDYDNEEVVKAVLLKEIANGLKVFLGGQHVQIFEHTVRKRHEIFPISTGEPYRYNQPTSIAHVDTTTEWAFAMAQQLNPRKAEKIGQHRLQCVNFWKPLVGPVRDWPLAMCNPTSIDPQTELEPCDLVYPDYVVENRQVYHSNKQKWFYLSNQMPNEAWVFLQADSMPGTNPIAHTAFPFPDVGPADVPPRESIEARALVYYGGFGFGDEQEE